MTVYKAYIYKGQKALRFNNGLSILKPNALFLLAVKKSTAEIRLIDANQIVSISKETANKIIANSEHKVEANIKRLLGDTSGPVKEKPAVQPAPVPEPIINPVNLSEKDFVSKLYELANNDRSLKVSQGLVGKLNFNHPSNGYHTSTALYICHLYDLYDIWLDQNIRQELQIKRSDWMGAFKEKLLKAHNSHLIRLSRADLFIAEAIPYIQRSAIKSGVAEWNLFNLDDLLVL